MVKATRDIALIWIFSVSSLAYESSWGPKEFYDAIHYCRSAIVLPAAADYKARALAHGRKDKVPDDEYLRMMPVFDYSATGGCFCVVDKAAKNHPATDFPSKINLEAYLKSPECAAEFQAPMAELFGDKSKIKKRMLP